MNVLEVIPVGYQIIVGYSLNELRHLRTIMDNMTFNMDSKDPRHIAANAYLHEKFYPELSQTLKELEANAATPNAE